MDKNTIWAIVLSTVVIIGFFFLQPILFGNKNDSTATEQTQLVSSESPVQEEVRTDSLFIQEETSLLDSELEAQAEEMDVTPAKEETISIDTGVAKVIFTTKGGDIISYKLSNHNDKETQDLVQLSDGITDVNRTCAIAIGGVEK